MVALLKNISHSEQTALLSLRPTDTWRNGRAKRLDSIAARAFFWLRELFSGGRSASDSVEFNRLYAKLQGAIACLDSDLENGAEGAFSQVQTLLKIEAQISVSSWGECLRGGEGLSYLPFQGAVEGLRLKAEKKIGGAPSVDPVLRRWIEANESQRRFAAFLGLSEVPYRFNEISRGAVILTDPGLYLKSAHLRKNSTIAKTILMRTKAFLAWLGTGKRYTHAELSLGNGEALDLDKRDGAWLSGQMKIQSRGERVFYGAVLSADEGKMFGAHRQSFLEKGLVPYGSFEDLWSAIDREARRAAPLMQATYHDLFHVGVQVKRSLGYEPMEAWRPGENTFACSAATSALFSKFGIDIGRQFDKMDRNIAPADFLSSDFFHPIYVPKGVR